MLSNELELVKGFITSHPVEATREIESLDSESALSVLRELPKEHVVTALKSMLPIYAAQLLLAAPLEFYIPYFKAFKARQVTAILAHFPEESRKAVYAALPEHQVKVLKLLLSYPQNTVGAYMRTQIEILPENIDVESALQRLMTSNIELECHAIPVVDQSRQLVGITDFKSLLQANAKSNLNHHINHVKALIPSRMSLSAAYQHHVWHSHDAAFVHNRDRQVIGMVRHLDLRHALLKTPEARDPYLGGSSVRVVGNAFAASLSAVGQYLSKGGRD